MPIQLSTNTLKIRESASDPWKASAVIVQSDLDTVLEITGDGVLDPSFTATDLTGAVNENKNTSTQKADEASLAYRRTGATNTGTQIENGTYFYLDGTLKRAIATIAQNASFTAQNCETVTAGGLNDVIKNFENTYVMIARYSTGANLNLQITLNGVSAVDGFLTWYDGSTITIFAIHAYSPDGNSVSQISVYNLANGTAVPTTSSGASFSITNIGSYRSGLIQLVYTSGHKPIISYN